MSISARPGLRSRAGPSHRSGGEATTARINRRWKITSRPDPDIGPSNFTWVEEPAPSPAEGQFLAQNLWFSFDPTQCFMVGRKGMRDEDLGAHPLGEVMGTIAVSRVVESRHPGFHPGDVVHGHMGWEDYSLSDGTAFTPSFRIPDGVPPNWALGALGITGLAAYFGVTEVAQPRAGETFVISGAAGGVGSIATQLAKLRGLRVIGIAGSPAKCAWVRDEGGADAAVDYHQEDVAQRLGELCPDGIDIYFDNDGGALLDLALERLRPGGRVVLCGATSRYTQHPSPPGPTNYLQLVMVNGRMQGLLARDYVPRHRELVDAILPLLRSGRLRSKEDVVVGLRHAPETLARLYRGANVGKQLLQLDAPPSG